MAKIRTHRRFRWLATFAEALVLLSCVVYLATGAFWALIGWQVVAVLYLAGGLVVTWRGELLDLGEVKELKAIARWTWIPPLVAAAVGAVSAVTVLAGREASEKVDASDTLVIAATIGIVLSWGLLQVGFAQMYLVTALTGNGDDIRFPDGVEASILNFAYFSFTIGTSFATSDVDVVSVRMRRLVLVHSIVAFFYNALVVAIAFQVLQQIA